MSRDLERFVRQATELISQPLVPEIRLHLATEMDEVWEKSEEALERIGVPAPFWAFAWAGGQALARYVLDHPDLVRGKHVLDLASGSGIVGIAAALAGAAQVQAAEIDPLCEVAIRLNAEANGVAVEVLIEDLIGTANRGWDAVLVADLFYEKAVADRAEPWLRELAGQGVIVLVGDPGRAYLPRSGLERVIRYRVDTVRQLEDTEIRNTSVWRFQDRA